ncbi:MAG TPA: nitrilase-related carbon-nitrogen hydrolase, partial [Candidatus Sulfotelmatobacter sp.]|nr:nitrilase-related carbon-nitrogen hydrolase [Candidatus Sulfotelmatobacter sp.]
ERVAGRDGLLFNTQVFIGSDGRLLGKRRKLFPSNREKVFWGCGGAEDIRIFPMDVGQVGGLICYEHLQPLLKYAIMAQGEQIHCASWPGWPEYKQGRTNRHVIDAASRQYALEAQCFVVASCLYVDEQAVPPGTLGNAAWAFFGGSGILNPSGEYLAGPLYHGEGILYADLDLGLIPLRKTLIDPTGRDQRWDILSLNLRTPAAVPIHSCPEVESEARQADRLQGLLDRLEVLVHRGEHASDPDDTNG